MLTSLTFRVLMRYNILPQTDFLILICRSLAVGTTSGYKLYSLSSTESLEPIYENGKTIDNIILVANTTIKILNIRPLKPIFVHPLAKDK